MRLIHGLLLCGFLCGLLGIQEVHAAFSITRTSSSVFYLDTSASPQLRGMYVSYQITSTTAMTDAWAEINSFTGSVISRAPNEDGVVHLGAFSAGQTKTAFFYLQATGATSAAETHTVSVYSQRPPASALASANFSMTAVTTIQAAANKVITVVSGPNPPGLGGLVTITVTGETGTIGSSKVLSFTPASFPDWPADKLELLTTQVVLSAPNPGTFNDTLLIPTASITSTANTSYTATYTFRATGTTSVSTAVSPVGYIASGGQIKHTDTSGYAALQAMMSVTSNLSLTQTASVATVPGNGGAVTYTITISNAGSAAATLDDLVDTLPGSPANAAYVAGSSKFNGTTIPDPRSTGQTLTWDNTFSIPANSSRTLTFNATLPATAGVYTNTVVGHVGTEQVDTTIVTTDNAPATAAVRVLLLPSIAKSFGVTSMILNSTTTLTLTLTNANTTTALTSVAVTDTFPAGLQVAATPGFSNTCGGTVSTGQTAGDTALVLSGGSLAANNSCQLQVNVTGSTAGDKVNTTGVVSSTNGGSGSTASATLTVIAPPSITKAFGAASIQQNNQTTLTLTLTNPANNTVALSNVAVTDAFPAGLQVAATPGFSNTCGGTISTGQTAGDTALVLSGSSLAANSSCQLQVSVTGTTLGNKVNTTSAVTSGNGGTGNTATATLQVEGPPSISKAFGVATISQNGVTTLTLTITNAYFSLTLNGVAVTDNFPAGLQVATTPGFSNTCGGTVTPGQTAGNTALVLSGGSIAPNSSCQIQVNVTGTTEGTKVNTTGAVTSNNGGTGNTASSTLTVLSGVTVSGIVYRDDNVNGTLDSNEPATGLTLFAKLLLNGVTQQVVAVSPGNGTYTFSGVAAGNYTIIINDNNNAADVTPALPAGWIGTEAPTQTRLITVGIVPILLQNFGLAPGTRLTGRVFQDTGGTGCTANNGVQETGTACENGLANVTVTLTNCGGTTYGPTALSNSSGDYTLIIPSTVANGTALCVVETNLSGYASVGGRAGTTGGTYNRAADTVTFMYSSNTNYSGVNFGDVPVPQFLPDGAQSGLPGTVVYYPHTFLAGSGGSVSFSTTAVATPTVAGWSETLYRDSNCNGQFDSGEPQLTTALTVVAGAQICLLVKQFIPTNAPLNAQNQVTVTASFTYTNANPPQLTTSTRTDLTTVGNPTSTGLQLLKSVDKAAALPGETITYTLTYTNKGSGSLSTIVINDATLAFTTFVSANCGTPLPASLTGCVVSTQPAAGATGTIIWTLTGTLASGGTGTVSYQVRFDQ